MNKNTSVTMAAAIAVAGILTLAVAIPHQAFAGQQQCSYGDNKKPCCDKSSSQIAMGGDGGSGGAGGAGGEGGNGGTNLVKDTSMLVKGSGSIDQKANGGDADGGHGGNANGGDASA